MLKLTVGQWSKSIYSYGMAVCLLESTAGTEADRKARVEEARKLMERVPGLRQKIAGKSIPLEVSCAYVLFQKNFPSLVLIN
jgi:hypothetical protein